MAAQVAGLRHLPAASLHATLCFLGSCAPDSAERIAVVCQPVAGARVEELALGEPAWLPQRRPRVLAVRIEDPRGTLREVQARLSELLARAGLYEPEERPFFPHVTVSRVPRGERVSPARLPSPPALPFAGESIALYRSRLGRGPAQYEVLKRISLSSPG